MEYPKVYIVVLNWNGWQDTIECLESVLKTNYSNYQVIVVDNGSTDESVEKIKAWVLNQKSPIKLLETKANLGYAGGNNTALRYAMEQGDFAYAWILNNDVVVHPDALMHMVCRMRKDPKIGICGSVILDYNNPVKIHGLGGFYDRWLAQAYCQRGDNVFEPKKVEQYKKTEKKMDYVPGACMLVSKGFVNDIGLMCEDYFLFFEEIDWAVRARGRYSLALALGSIVYHKGSVSIKKKEAETTKKAGRFGLIYDQYITKNRLLFTLKFYPYALPVVYLSILGYILDRLLFREWENAKVIAQMAFQLPRKG